MVLFLLLLQLFHHLALPITIHFKPGFVRTIFCILPGVSIKIRDNKGSAETMSKKSSKKNKGS